MRYEKQCKVCFCHYVALGSKSQYCSSRCKTYWWEHKATRFARTRLFKSSKICRDCLNEKPLSEFYSAVRKGRLSREYMARCKVCSAVYCREQYYKHHSKRLAYHKDHRARNGDAIRARQRARWQLFGELLNVVRRIRYRENPRERERAIANAASWRKQNLDKKRVHSARYTKRSVDELREWYIKDLIAHHAVAKLDKNKIPPALVAAWAANIKLKRLIKQQELNEKCS